MIITWVEPTPTSVEFELTLLITGFMGPWPRPKPLSGSLSVGQSNGFSCQSHIEGQHFEDYAIGVDAGVWGMCVFLLEELDGQHVGF